MTDILKHISIVVLQVCQSEIKTEAEDINIKREQDVTHNLIASVKILKEVKDSVLLCVFILFLSGDDRICLDTPLEIMAKL